MVIVLCADPTQSGVLWEQNYYLVDSGIASQNLMLAARAQGLGTVFVGIYDEEKVKQLLNIPASIRVIGLFPLGYPWKTRRTGLREKRFPKYASRVNGEARPDDEQELLYR